MASAKCEGWTFGHIARLARVARYFPLDLPENVVMRGANPAVAALAAD